MTLQIKTLATGKKKAYEYKTFRISEATEKKLKVAKNKMRKKLGAKRFTYNKLFNHFLDRQAKLRDIIDPL